MMPKLVLMHKFNEDNGYYSKALPAEVQLEFYDENHVYDLNTVFLYDWSMLTSPWKSGLENQLKQGRRVIIDYKAEHLFFIPSALTLLAQYPDQHLLLTSAVESGTIEGINVSAVTLWYWWELQRNYQQQALKNYVPVPTHQKKFLCQMRCIRRWRDVVFNRLRPWHNQALCSYVEHGIYLPGDLTEATANFQRYVNTDWYNNSDFTLTVETSVLPCVLESPQPGGRPLLENHGVLISEKTYKPLGMLHPFMIMGQPTALESIRKAGFETFSELWDESYDNEVNFFKRLDCIVENIQQFDHRSLDNPLTQGKLQHNRNRFFDQSVIDQKLKQQIIDPIIKFLNIQ